LSPICIKYYLIHMLFRGRCLFFLFKNKIKNMIKNSSFLVNKTNYFFSPSLNMAFFKTLSTSSKQKIKINNIVAYDLEAIN